jgi:hypothetical protein
MVHDLFFSFKLEELPKKNHKKWSSLAQSLARSLAQMVTSVEESVLLGTRGLWRRTVEHESQSSSGPAVHPTGGFKNGGTPSSHPYIDGFSMK